MSYTKKPSFGVSRLYAGKGMSHGLDLFCFWEKELINAKYSWTFFVFGKRN
jgi:hypothetical protein